MIRTEPRSHQLEAVERAKPFDGFCFFGQMRTGKLLQALMMIDYWKPTDVLVVCPKIVVDEWHRQMETHLIKDWDVGIHVVSFESFRINRRAWYKWGEKCHNLAMIIDEAHAIKKRGSSQSSACRTMGKRAKKRLLLTGTPIAQGRQDAWALMDFVQPGLFGKYAEFEEKYLKVKSITNPATGAQWTKVIGYKNTEEFDAIFHRYSHRITLNEARKQAGIKPVKVRRQVIKCELNHSTKQLYKELEQELEADFNGLYVETANTLTLSLKLQQLAGGWVKPLDSDQYYRVDTTKIDRFRELLSENLRWPIVTVCRYLHEFDDLVNVFRSRGIDPLQIKGGTGYNGNFQGEAAVLQVQSGKGIDLAIAKSIIFYSCDYSYINFDQIRYRIRSFNVEQVNEYFLLCKGTIDDQIHKALTKKQDLATLVCDYYRMKNK